MINNKSILITGGTGSFGNAVLDMFLESDIGEIRIFSRDEKKQDDMRKKYNNNKNAKAFLNEMIIFSKSNLSIFLPSMIFTIN